MRSFGTLKESFSASSKNVSRCFKHIFIVWGSFSQGHASASGERNYHFSMAESAQHRSYTKSGKCFFLRQNHPLRHESFPIFLQLNDPLSRRLTWQRLSLFLRYKHPLSHESFFVLLPPDGVVETVQLLRHHFVVWLESVSSERKFQKSVQGLSVTRDILGILCPISHRAYRSTPVNILINEQSTTQH